VHVVIASAKEESEPNASRLSPEVERRGEHGVEREELRAFEPFRFAMPSAPGRSVV
jgi:hypothetical protein